MYRLILSLFHIIYFATATLASQWDENDWSQNAFSGMSQKDIQFIEEMVNDANIIQEFTHQQMNTPGARPSQSFLNLDKKSQYGAKQAVEMLHELMGFSVRGDSSSSHEEQVESVSSHELSASESQQSEESANSKSSDDLSDLLDDAFDEFMQADKTDESCDLKQEPESTSDFEQDWGQLREREEIQEKKEPASSEAPAHEKRSKGGSPTERLMDTVYEEGKEIAVKAVNKIYKGRNQFENGDITYKTVARTMGAYGLDGVNYAAQKLDAATLGFASWTGEKMDTGAEYIGTGVRQTTQYVTGDQRLAQNLGDMVYLGLSVVNPLNKATLPAQITQKIVSINKITKSARAFEALNLETTLSAKVNNGAAHRTSPKSHYSQNVNNSTFGAKSFLQGEGRVASFGELKKFDLPGDNLSAHHVPHDQYMKSRDVSRKNGVAIMVEDPFPGSGGRHREIHKTLKKQDVSLEPRDALAQGVNRIREVYKQDGLYSEIRPSLVEAIQQNKTLHPNLFEKK